MPETLLRTKLFIPPLRPNFVPRPRLIERLNQGLELGHRLSLISAPAGFGKTTLISEWINESERAATWLSLDEADSNPIRFLTYLVGALQTIAAERFPTGTIGEGVLAMLKSPQSPPIGSILTALVNDITTIPDGIILVLDDYHLIDSSSIDEAVSFLVEHLPPLVHLVITTRSDPKLHLSRHRARGQLTELRAADLRFTLSEVSGFLNQVMRLNLSSEVVTALESRTEGWIAGLHLAALSMQGRENINRFIVEFTGDDRYIVDYLVDEVLAQRPIGTKDFLLKTSCLSQLTGSLCDAVTGEGNGQELLEKLDQANLFITPLDNRRRWYRYHNLFADVLRQRLTEVANTHEIAVLHQRASQWYEENDFLVEAVGHALAARDFDNVFRLIDLGSMEILMHSQQNLLLKWQAEIPPEALTDYPRVRMIIAWAWLSTGHLQETEESLQLIEQSLGPEVAARFSNREQAEMMDPSIRVFLVEITVMRLELAMQTGDIPRVFKLAQQVLPFLESEDGSRQNDHIANLRSVVFFVLGLAYKISGKLSDAVEALSLAAALGRELGNVYIATGSIGRLAGVQAMQGHLSLAMNTCQQGLDWVQEMTGEPPMAGLIHAELGNLLYERNHLEAANRHLQEGIELAKPWAFIEAFLPGYTGLARLKAAYGDWKGAFAALDELALQGEGNPAMVTPAVDTLRAMLWVSQGKIDTVKRWAMKIDYDPAEEIEYQRIGELLILARVLMAQGAQTEAIELLTRMMRKAEKAGWFGKAIEIRVLLVLAHQAREDIAQVMSTLEQVLIFAEEEGYVRVFLNEGDRMKSLLHDAKSRSIASDYIGLLFEAFEADTMESEPTSVPLSIEPLSKRELEVLRLLKTELSGPEIADELMIALSTLRTHTQNIYGKLGVSNRREAVLIAKELDIR